MERATMSRTSMQRTKEETMQRTNTMSRTEKKKEWSLGGHVPDPPENCPHHFVYNKRRWTDCAMCYHKCNPIYCTEAQKHLDKATLRKTIQIKPRETNGKK